VQCAQGPEAPLGTGQHEIAHHRTADAAGTGLSTANAKCTTSPFQQAISSPSDGQRRLVPTAITRPSWARTGRNPTWGSRHESALSVRLAETSNEQLPARL
jgi:hypothetical protein